MFEKHPFLRFAAVALLCGAAFGQTPATMTYKVILADEGNGKIHYVNLANPTEKWTASTSNRDLQVIGEDRLMASVGNGYAEYDLKTGVQRKKVAVPGTVQSAFRLTRKSVFVGLDNSPPAIVEVDSTGKQLRKIPIAVDVSLRLVKPTMKKTYLMGGRTAGLIYEVDSTGKVIWQANAGGEPYMALRLPNGNTMISTGYGAQMALANPAGTILKKFPMAGDISGNSFWTQAKPFFFGGFHVMRNGNVVVANWEDHGPGHGGTGYQLLEFDGALTKVVSYWKQDASFVSSLHGVLVLNELDTKLLYSDLNGSPIPIINDIPVSALQPARMMPGAYPGRIVSGQGGAWGLLLDLKSGRFDLGGRRIAIP